MKRINLSVLFVMIATSWICAQKHVTLSFNNYDGKYAVFAGRDTLASSVATNKPVSIKLNHPEDYPGMVVIVLEGQKKPEYTYFNPGDTVVISYDDNKKAFEINSGIKKEMEAYTSSGNTGILVKKAENLEARKKILLKEINEAADKNDGVALLKLKEKTEALKLEKETLSKQYLEAIYKDAEEVDKSNIASFLTISTIAQFLVTDMEKYERTMNIYEAFKKRLGLKIISNAIKALEQKLPSLQLAEKTKPGTKYIDIEAMSLNGKSLKLSQVLKKNKVVLLKFWATWCGPCIKSIPGTLDTYNKYHDKGFEVFAVSLDDKKKEAKWRSKIKQLGIENWKHVSELKGWEGSQHQKYGVTGIPFEVLIASDGTIIGKNLHGKNLEEKLEKYLK